MTIYTYIYTNSGFERYCPKKKKGPPTGPAPFIITIVPGVFALLMRLDLPETEAFVEMAQKEGPAQEMGTFRPGPPGITWSPFPLASSGSEQSPSPYYYYSIGPPSPAPALRLYGADHLLPLHRRRRHQRPRISGHLGPLVRGPTPGFSFPSWSCRLGSKGLNTPPPWFFLLQN